MQTCTITLPNTEEFENVMKWCERFARDGQTMLMVGDGMSKTIITFVVEWFDTNIDEAKRCDLWTTYADGTDDLHEASRKVTFSANNRDLIFVGVPVTKTKLKTPRWGKLCSMWREHDARAHLFKSSKTSNAESSDAIEAGHC